MKNVLITGGSGYIGINLHKELNKIGINCIVIDMSNKSWIGYNKVENLVHLNGIDGVVHLAAVSGIANCMENKKQAIESNISASFKIFDLCKKHNIPCIFTSSQAAKTPNANFYAMTKYIAEVEATRLNSDGADIKIFRLTNVYGGLKYLQTKDTVVSKFAKAYHNREKLIVNGKGNQKRDFIHVEDVCRAIILGLRCKMKILNPIDIGTGESISVLDLAKMFGDIFTFDEDSDKVGTLRNVAETKKALEMLGFKSKWKVKDYVKSVKK